MVLLTCIISNNYVKMIVDSYDSLLLEKAMNFHKFVILIKSVFSKDKNNYYYNIFLEKSLKELPKR